MKKFKRSTGPHMTKNPPLEPKQVVCSVCGRPGHTMGKVNDVVVHSNPMFCRAAKREEDRRKADEYVEKLKTEEKGEQSPTTR